MTEIIAYAERHPLWSLIYLYVVSWTVVNTFIAISNITVRRAK